MKNLLLISLFLLIGCESNISQRVKADEKGKVIINGKTCEVISIDAGDNLGRILFIDCGPGSSSVTYPQNKTSKTISEYNPPSPEASCSCPTNHAEEMKKIEEIKKGFYK